MVHTYNRILLNHKKEIISFAATWMDLEMIILSEVSQTEKVKYHMTPLICRIQKKVQMTLFTKQKSSRSCRKQT